MPHQMMIIYALVIVAVSPFHFYATAVFRSSRVRSEKSLSTARRCAASSCAELGLNVFVPMFTVGNRLTAWTRCCVEVVAAECQHKRNTGSFWLDLDMPRLILVHQRGKKCHMMAMCGHDPEILTANCLLWLCLCRGPPFPWQHFKPHPTQRP